MMECAITKKENVIHDIITAMSTTLEAAALRILDNVLRTKLQGIRLEEECTELSTWRDDNEYILQVFQANKKLEGCKDGTLEQYRITARQLFNFCNKNFRDVTKDDVKIFLAVRSQTVKKNTIANQLRNLSSFFSWLHEEGYICKNPTRGIKGIRTEQAEKIHLTIEEEVSIRDQKMSLRDRALIDFLLSTGVRVGEAVNMNIDDVDFRTGAVTFRGEKNDKIRTVYLDARAKKHLAEYLESRIDRERALFVTERNYNGAPMRMSNHGMEMVTKSAGTLAGIKKTCTVHVFRRTFATRLWEKSCPIEVIQELLGHKSPDTTQKHYVSYSQKRLQNEFERCMAA